MDPGPPALVSTLCENFRSTVHCSTVSHSIPSYRPPLYCPPLQCPVPRIIHYQPQCLTYFTKSAWLVFTFKIEIASCKPNLVEKLTERLQTLLF